MRGRDGADRPHKPFLNPLIPIFLLVADHYDVIVSGAGPSGSRAAYLCAQEGFSVLLMEKKVITREKCCAGGVLYRASQLLGEQAVLIPRQSIIRGVRVLLEDRTFSWNTEEELGYTVLRKDLDSILALEAQEAGCELIQGEKVSSIQEDWGRVNVSSDQGHFSADYLVMAEGAASGNATKLLGPYPKRGIYTGAALVCDRDMEIDERAGFIIDPNKGETPSFSRYGARIYAAFPIKEGTVLSTIARASGSTLRTVLYEVASRYGFHPKGPFCIHPIPVIARERIATRRCLAVGDCAGLASPFSGEGLSPSLESANLAAEAIILSVRKGEPLLRGYEAQVRDQLQMDQYRARLIGAAVRLAIGGKWAGAILSGLEVDPGFQRAIVSVARRRGGSESILMGILPRIPAILAYGLGRR